VGSLCVECLTGALDEVGTSRGTLTKAVNAQKSFSSSFSFDSLSSQADAIPFRPSSSYLWAAAVSSLLTFTPLATDSIALSALPAVASYVQNRERQRGRLEGPEPSMKRSFLSVHLCGLRRFPGSAGKPGSDGASPYHRISLIGSWRCCGGLSLRSTGRTVDKFKAAVNGGPNQTNGR
jgi:hypothetical protein